MRVLRKVLLILTAAMPFNRLRIFLYRSLFGYQISYDSQLGFGNFLDLQECRIERGRIGHFNFIRAKKLALGRGSRIERLNRFRDAQAIVIGCHTQIMNRNVFNGTRPGVSPFKPCEDIIIGDETVITVGHLFDLSGSITIGNNVVFGGRGIEIWTHGFDINRIMVVAPVCIGSDIYIGSQSLIIQGVQIADRVSIGAGTVVSKSIAEPGFYTSSQLIKKSEAADYSQSPEVVIHRNGRFIRK